MPDAIAAQAVTVTREGRRALEGVDMIARHGQVTMIVGPNGAGKSTLLKAIAGLLPYAGRITLEGQDNAPLSPRERARLCAFVPQQTQLRAPMLVRDVVAQGRYARVSASSDLRATDHALITRCLDECDAAMLAERPFTELSGGEQRRVLIARALCTEARVLLFDEPTASLDVQHVLALHALVRRQAEQGAAVVMVLHHLGDALRFGDHALLLHAGRVVAAGAPAEVIVESTVRAVYGVQMIANADPGFAAKVSP